jgi:predicted O-methyltransferase YrrM
MQLGRFRTWINAVLKRPALRRATANAFKTYRPLLLRLKISIPFKQSDRIGRFAHHVLYSNLPRPVRYLEIGAFEGQSLAFVHALLDGQMLATVIDPFADYSEHADTDMRDVFSTFSANIEAIGAQQAVGVLRGRSIDHLPALIDAGEQFDFIYIDGSHANLDVILDAVLGWQLLAPRGLMVFDDYWYRRVDLGRSFRPKLAVDAFVGAMSHEIEVLDVAGQVYIRKNGASS